MIKSEILSYIKGEVGRVDPTASFHLRFLEAVIERVLIEMYADLYKTKPLLLDLYTKTYGATTPISISFESASGIYYSTLPAKIVNLPCKSSGVRHIYTIAQSGNVFVPMDAREADLIFNSDAGIVSSKIGYRVRQDTRVDYWNTNAIVRSAGVRMDLLIPFSVYGETEVVMIPELGEKEGGSFLQRVLQALSGVREPNLEDTNAPTKEKTNNNNE